MKNLDLTSEMQEHYAMQMLTDGEMIAFLEGLRQQLLETISDGWTKISDIDTELKKLMERTIEKDGHEE